MAEEEAVTLVPGAIEEGPGHAEEGVNSTDALRAAAGDDTPAPLQRTSYEDEFAEERVADEVAKRHSQKEKGIQPEDAWDKVLYKEKANWTPVVGPAVLLIGGSKSNPGAFFPPEIQDEINTSNCNHAIHVMDGRLFVAWRSARYHFADPTAKMILASAPFDHTLPLDQALKSDWVTEKMFCIGADMREPYFYEMKDTLYFTYFKGGETSTKFQPQLPLRIKRLGLSQWSEAVEWNDGSFVASEAADKKTWACVPWQYNRKPGDPGLYLSTYASTGFGGVAKVKLIRSEDGETWTTAAGTCPFQQASYPPLNYKKGGIDEAGFAFTLEGEMWAVGRNEYGDESGFGSRVFRAPPEEPGNWEAMTEHSDPRAFMSPRCFRFANDIYMISRNDPTGVYDRKGCCSNKCMSHACKFWTVELAHTLRRHTTVLSRIDREDGEINILKTLPGCGDTAFPSFVRVSEKRILVANYSSPLDAGCDGYSWIRAQTSKKGTQVHLYYIDFE